MRKCKPSTALRFSPISLVLAVPCAFAQDTGLGTDLQFGTGLDPSGGTAWYGCDPDGTSWLTGSPRRTPTGFLYACPPDWPPFNGGEGWRYRGLLSLGYLGVSGDTENMIWRRYSNWVDGVYVET